MSYYLGARWHDTASSGTIPMSIARQYTITYDANGGIDAPAPTIKKYGTAVYITDYIPTREGADFLGWSSDRYSTTPEYRYESRYTNNSDVVLYAVWSIKTYTEAIRPSLTALFTHLR